MYGLTGMLLYGNEIDPSPRRNFDNIGSSMLSLFVVLTNDAVNTELVSWLLIELVLGSGKRLCST